MIMKTVLTLKKRIEKLEELVRMQDHLIYTNESVSRHGEAYDSSKLQTRITILKKELGLN